VSTNKPPLLSILLFSAAGLAFEVLLMRLFSIVHWHHFAYMIISVALLGFGASGTFVAIFQTRLLASFQRSYLLNGALFAASILVSFLIAQGLPFNTLEVLWDPRQWLWLAAVYVLLAVPFFFLANLFALSFQRFDRAIGRVYGADLIGAGLGAAAILGLLYLVPPTVALKLTATTAAVAWVIARQELAGAHLLRWTSVVAVLVAGVWLVPVQLAMTPYKGLPQALLIPGTSVVASHSSPLGLVTVIESPQVPFHHAPGMSLSSPAKVPPQLGVFTDGDGFSTITSYRGDIDEVRYLDALTSALPYHLKTSPRALVVGADGDAILQAVSGGAAEVDVVEINPDRVDLLKKHHADYFGWQALASRVVLRTAEVRAWLLSDPAPYDLIVFPLGESSVAAGAGVHGLMEDFLFTTEALALYWSKLTDAGVLSVSRWLKLPPRDELKLINMAIDVLAADGIIDPGAHLALIRGWKTTTLIVARQPIDEAGAAVIRRFVEERSFDVAYYPGIAASEVNRFNRLRMPFYADGVRRLLGDDRTAFVRDYPFDIAPSSVNRPYFFQFFRWSNLPTVLRLREVGGLSYFEWGYPILVMTLIQAVLASVCLIIAPLLVRAELRRSLVAAGGWVVGYFGVLGVAFMFLEMAFIQRLTLFLHHPVHAAVVVLSSLLVFAGLGSRYAEHLATRFDPRLIIRVAAFALAGLALVYLVLLPPLFSACLAWPLWARLVLSLAVLAPLALLLGMPFPMGLTRLSRARASAVPWAWCINGCASVISAVAGTLAAVHWGFTAVVMIAAGGYVLIGIMGQYQVR
jgi:hypothetical protein